MHGRRPFCGWFYARRSRSSVGGTALGVLVALAASRYIQTQLFGVTPGDPGAIAAAILLLVAVTALAGYLPARRASRINPVVALRYE